MLHRLLRGFGPRTHQDKNALGVICTDIVIESVLPAGQFGEAVHALLHDFGHRLVIGIDALPGLEKDIRILRGAADHRMLGIEGTAAVRIHQCVIDHRTHDVAVDLFNLVDLVGGAETVEDVQHRYTSLEGGSLGDERHVHHLLHRVGKEHGKAGGAGCHHIAVIAEDGEGLRGQ